MTLLQLGGMSLRVHSRTAVVGALLTLAVLLGWFWALLPGSDVMSPGQVLSTLAGQGSLGDEAVVYGWQMPRALSAVLVGLALGTAGAIFQSLTRNPLGSPEVIGFTTGAATGALLSLTLVATLPTSLGALVGGAVAAAVIVLMAHRDGLRVYRLVLVGIGVNAMLLAANWFLISRADFYDAKTAANWLIGSLDGRGWDHVQPLLISLAILLPLTLSMGRHLRMLELGDEHTRTLGLRVDLMRLILLICGVSLTAVAVAAAGPIAFVSLTAPQLTKILCRSGHRPLIPSALMGAVLLVISDILATHATEHLLPVGVVTGVLGGSYLLWLLASGRA